ncbi:MAG: nucleoside deaminase [Firmicutes bacterium]|nr:nucleoside deaminase [Bacillota bacterium]
MGKELKTKKEMKYLEKVDCECPVDAPCNGVDEKATGFMAKAICMAKKGQKAGEIPVGAVIVRNGKIIAQAYNMREKRKVALYHAEMLAIAAACRKVKGWRLDDCEMYVTLQPCIMCAGGILNSRIKKVYIGALKDGEPSSSLDVYKNNTLNWTTEVEVMHNEECSAILKDFFKGARNGDNKTTPGSIEKTKVAMPTKIMPASDKDDPEDSDGEVG